jgi:hypothetical protein
MNVRLGADAVPESLTRRLPFADTVVPGWCPLNFSVPSLSITWTLVVAVGRTRILALGFAEVTPPANDQVKWYEGRNTAEPPPDTALKNQEPWMPEHDAP